MTMQPIPLPVILSINEDVQMIVTHLDDAESFIRIEVRCVHCRSVLTYNQIDVSQLAQVGAMSREDALAAKAHIETCVRRRAPR